MNELPESWFTIALSDISMIEMGQSPNSSSYNDQGKGLPFFQGKAEFGKLYPTVRKWCTDPTKIAEAGDILLSVRAPVGPTNLAIEKCCIGRGLSGIRAYPPINQRYLLYHFRNIEDWLSKQGTGTTFTAISGNFIRSLEVPIAPPSEQKRIAGKLDSLLARVDACQAHLERVPQLLKRFRQAVLAAATSGRLTEDWREEKGIDFGDWENTDFESVCKEITVGYVGKMASEYREEGIPFLRSLNVRPFRFDPNDLKFISKEFHKKISKSALHPGDVVIVRSGAPGQCCVLPSDLPEANCSDLVIVRVGSRLLPNFAVVFINSEVSQSFVRSEQVGVAQQHFNVGSMKKAPLHLPSVEEQGQIVRRVERLFAYADRLEARYQIAAERVERLTPSLLAKAFSGELVEQDPNDEPAEVLLERIRAQRALQPEKVKRVVKSTGSRELKMTEDSVKEIIRKLPKRKFSFDDLRKQVPGDYEQLRDILFKLLGENPASITQEFDKSAQAMRFVRRSK